MQRILVVEDEPKLASLLQDYLAAAGYAVEWLDAGETAVQRALHWPADLLLLDWMLPGKDGLTVCRELRQCSALPIMMLTARVEEIDRILGLEIGADDYICKPFSPREVVARVRAQLRRAGMSQTQQAQRLQLDPACHRAALDGQPLELTPVEYRLLQALARHPGAVLSRGQLIDAAYDDHRIVSERTMDSHAKNLRRKLEAVTGLSEPSLLEGVYGVGYRLNL